MPAPGSPTSTPEPIKAPGEITQQLTSPKASMAWGKNKTTGAQVIANRSINKGTAFTNDERDYLKLHGLLPVAVETIEQQIARCEELMDSIIMVDDAQAGLMKYQYLTTLRTTNETLFYALLQRNIRKYMPFVYTPTVGLACQKFSHLYGQNGEGVYLSVDYSVDMMRSILKEYAEQKGSQISIVVVTDGSRILGLGDLGVNGMGIPIGKLALYVAAGGFHPTTILPITLDLGTCNKGNLADPMYLGKRCERPESSKFYEFTDSFVETCSELFPKCVIQFEDFENKHCFQLLDRNRSKYRCFNDDIQGTGVVAAAGFLSAMKYIKKMHGTETMEHRVVFYGFGSATAGVANQIVACLQESTGLPYDELAKLFYMVDSRGLCTMGRGDHLPEYKLPFTRKETDLPHGASLAETIEFVKPTAIIGLSGQSGAFTKEICQKMAAMNKNPIIFSLSNPTANSECVFSNAMEWTDGRVVWAAGSPMASHNGRISPQGNNLYAFPGIGFGAWLAQVDTITDSMMTTATNAISGAVSDEKLLELYPNLEAVGDVADIVAAEVMRVALEEGKNGARVPATHEERIEYVKAHRYQPIYGASI